MHKNELRIPPAAEMDPKAVELVRVWAAGGRQHIILASDVFDDPASWGIALVDLAKLLADAYHKSRGDNSDEVLRRIKTVFDMEWNTATDTPSGDLLR